MDAEYLITNLANVMFPALMCIYLISTFNKTLQSLTQIISDLKKAVDDLSKTTKN